MKKLLIVNPIFEETFIYETEKALKEDYEISSFFITNKSFNPLISKYFYKVINLFYINILGKRNYYQILEQKRKTKFYLKCLRKIKNKKYDKILFCRGDLLPEFVLKKLSEKSLELITYQCDGTAKCPKIFYKKKYFTKIFSFEKKDIINFPELNFKFITNFYFEINNDNEYSNKKIDFYYIGVGLMERIEIIKKLDFMFSEYHNVFILTSKKKTEATKSIILMNQGLKYDENLKFVNNCRVIIDIKLEEHDGLSFRFFEGIYYRKKIITNNADVINYDFYHPNNILIVNYNNVSKEEIISFVQKEYYPLDQKIISKYSFRNWINKILD